MKKVFLACKKKIKNINYDQRHLVCNNKRHFSRLCSAAANVILHKNIKLKLFKELVKR